MDLYVTGNWCDSDTIINCCTYNLYGGKMKLIDRICVKNGFTLSEVRRIRKQLRELGMDQAKGSLISAFSWKNTPQGYEYWRNIHKTLLSPKKKKKIPYLDVEI